MKLISFSQSGSFDNIEKFLKKQLGKDQYKSLQRYGEYGVVALSNATPKDTGKTAESWGYEINYDGGEVSITWTNSNLAERGMPVALLIQYGHGTRNGRYVEGIDYINPALKPIFDAISEEVWKEVVYS